MGQYINSKELNKAIDEAYQYCFESRNEFITPEHLLMAFIEQSGFSVAVGTFGGDNEKIKKQVQQALNKMESVPQSVPYNPIPSKQYETIMDKVQNDVHLFGDETVSIPHLTGAIMQLEESQAGYILKNMVGERGVEFIVELMKMYRTHDSLGFLSDDDYDDDDDDDGIRSWRQLVTCINDTYESKHPLIGREKELERTIQVLCRKEKNNPLHVGEPGVGKTALVYGLAARIERGEVPTRLRYCKIYLMDMGTILAGTQYRGDMEKRIKMIMDGVTEEGDAIVYIDEIHNLVGAGRSSDGSLDASNMLKPYLEGGDVRFIGSTTYAEYNRYFAKSAGVVRRFQQIDIPEPSVEETIGILKGLQKQYEKFHRVTYTSDAITFAARSSAKFITGRFLPDKAIDLIDEAGAYRELHPLTATKQTVDKSLIADVLAKVCKIESAAMKEESNEALSTLKKRIKAKIYGQDEAVEHVVEAVQMAKAGLTEDDKPLASLLFVGPTGVGKTEVARVLSQELGIELVRFDMSEYTEKHAVAKLIGSPAGYVGYEDGGLLTDAIRNNPNCVLLLDEIEKAHADIYNILLQVMDYAKLTDNKGYKTDFRNVVLIMTSNAGAQFASQANVGFNGNTSRGEAMLTQVKKTFKPEFINRLSATVVFHDMDRKMAQLILRKKIDALQTQLDARKVTLTLTKEAENHLLELGFTAQYGAREMDRVIAAQLKPLLTKEILFGKLKRGGLAKVDLAPNKEKEEQQILMLTVGAKNKKSQEK